MQIPDSFDGVFRFTNNTDEDFTALWNNKEYSFPSKTSCPMIILNEPLENIQEIRKKWAYKLATREFFKSKAYNKLSKMGKGLPPTYDDKILQPWVDECLVPLPPSRAKIRELKKDSEQNYRVSKAVSDKDNLNYEFKDAPIVEKGVMPNTEI